MLMVWTALVSWWTWTWTVWWVDLHLKVPSKCLIFCHKKTILRSHKSFIHILQTMLNIFSMNFLLYMFIPSAPVIPCEARCLGTPNLSPKPLAEGEVEQWLEHKGINMFFFATSWTTSTYQTDQTLDIPVIQKPKKKKPQLFCWGCFGLWNSRGPRCRSDTLPLRFWLVAMDGFRNPRFEFSTWEVFE